MSNENPAFKKADYDAEKAKDEAEEQKKKDKKQEFDDDDDKDKNTPAATAKRLFRVEEILGLR